MIWTLCHNDNKVISQLRPSHIGRKLELKNSHVFSGAFLLVCEPYLTYSSIRLWKGKILQQNKPIRTEHHSEVGRKKPCLGKNVSEQLLLTKTAVGGTHSTFHTFLFGKLPLESQEYGQINVLCWVGTCQSWLHTPWDSFRATNEEFEKSDLANVKYCLKFLLCPA